MVACSGGGYGGGDDGSGPPEPPPPSVPPVVTTATAVQVSKATPFSDNCLALPQGSVLYASSEVEPHLTINPANPNHLVAAWQQDRLSDGGARGIVTAVSVDGGTSWSGHQAAPFSQCAGPGLARVSDPWVSMAGDTLIQVGIAFTPATTNQSARSQVLASRSVDGGFTWSTAITLIDDAGSEYFNDKESATIDPTNPLLVYAVWDRLDQDGWGPTMLARSEDGGLTWSTPEIIYDPGGAGRQTIGNVIVVGHTGSLFNFFTELAPAPGNPDRNVGHLAVIRSDDKGSTWSEPIRIAELLSVPTNIPAPPGSAVRAGEIIGTFAADRLNGALYAVWQDSRFTGGSHNSIVMAWSEDDGASWSEPVTVNAELAVPAFTPTVAVLPNGIVGVSYYDFRRAASPGFQPTEFWLTISRDRQNWQEVSLAGNFDLLNAPNAGGLFLGDYQGLVGYDATFVALYSRVNNGDSDNRNDIFADRVDTASIDNLSINRKPTSSAYEATIPAWTPQAQARVSQHLSEVRKWRLRQWHQWQEAGRKPVER